MRVSRAPTDGLRSMRDRKPRLSSRAASRIKPMSTAMPASRSFLNPPPATRGFGSSHAATTRETPAAITRIRARRRFAEMRARFERDVSGRAACAFAGIAQREHFGVRFAGALVPAFGDDFVAVRDHAADARIGLRREQPALGQSQRARHVRVVGRGEFGHCAFLRGARVSPSSGSCRPSSSGRSRSSFSISSRNACTSSKRR